MKKQDKIGYLFILPTVLAFFTFVALPIVLAIVLSFTNYRGFGTVTFVGFEQYRKIFEVDPNFLRSFRNLAIYVGILVPGLILISLSLAVLINSKFVKRKSIYRILFYTPTLMSIIAASAIWRFLYDPNYGPINQFLLWIGVKRDSLPLWIYEPNLAMISITIMSLWMVIGINMVIYMAALSSFPEEIKEAAEIDGAGSWTIFWRIIFPLIKPTTYFIVTMSIIGSFQLFDQIFALTGGGPAGSTMTPVFLIYGNIKNQMGYASAQSVILFIVIIVVTLLAQKFTKEEA